MMKLIIAFNKFANMSENSFCFIVAHCEVLMCQVPQDMEGNTAT